MKEEPENKNKLFYCYGRGCPIKDDCVFHHLSKELPEKFRGEYRLHKTEVDGLVISKKWKCEYFKNVSEN